MVQIARPLVVVALCAAGLAGALFLLTQMVSASAILDDGTAQLGVNEHGNLIASSSSAAPSCGYRTRMVGIRLDADQCDGLGEGCTCEGWGIAADGSTSAWADAAYWPATSGMTLTSFASTATMATSVVQAGDLEVTHAFGPSSVAGVYAITTTVHNTGTVAHGDLVYRRTMDWDADPTPFDEYVSVHAGFPYAPDLAASCTNLAPPDPLVDGSTSCAAGSPYTRTGPPAAASFDRNGPSDQGTYMDFRLGSLTPGASRTFTMYYGALSSRGDADGAASTLHAQAWSIAEPDPAHAPAATNAYLFAVVGLGTPPTCAQVTPSTNQDYADTCVTPCASLTPPPQCSTCRPSATTSPRIGADVPSCGAPVPCTLRATADAGVVKFRIRIDGTGLHLDEKRPADPAAEKAKLTCG